MKKPLSFLLIFCLILSLFIGCAEQSKETNDPIPKSDDPIIEIPVDEKPYDVIEDDQILKFKPVVTVRDGEYEILVTLLNPGTCSIIVGDQVYTATDDVEDKWNYFKIRVPQSQLDAVKDYAICYLPEGTEGKPQGVEFQFKPIEKTEGINVYVTSDVHCYMDAALEEYEYWGDDLDLIVCNGDFLDKLPMIDDVFTIISYYGEFSRGRYPLIEARGNHEYNTYYGEHKPSYDFGDGGVEKYVLFISENGVNYYKFSIGPINGVVLDCFDTENLENETEFLNNITLDDSKIKMVITHCCPIYPMYSASENENYEKWNNKLNDLGIDFMVCGHYHSEFIIEPNSSMSTYPNEYPVICGNIKWNVGEHCGMALTLYQDKVDVTYTFNDLSVRSKTTVQYPLP